MTPGSGCGIEVGPANGLQVALHLEYLHPYRIVVGVWSLQSDFLHNVHIMIRHTVITQNITHSGETQNELARGMGVCFFQARDLVCDPRIILSGKRIPHRILLVN